TLEQLTPYADRVNQIFMSMPEFDHSFQITFPTGGFGGMLVKPWGERKRSVFQIQPELGLKLGSIPGVHAPAFPPPALPSAGSYPAESVIASTANHEEIVQPAQRVVQEAWSSGQFAFPPITDVKIDQAKSEIVLDRDKISSMGLQLSDVGNDL